MVRDYKHYQNISQTQKRISPPNTYGKFGRMRNLDKKVILAVFLIVLVLCTYLALFRKGEPDFTVARYGRLVDQFDGKGLLIKSEQVFYAPFAGKVKLLVENEKRYPAGSSILELSGAEGKKIYFTRESGLVSFEVDGLENTLKPVMLDNFQQNYRDFRGKLLELEDDEKVNAGRPLFKLVDNFVLYMLVEAPAQQVNRYQVGEKVWVTFSELTIVGWVKRILGHRNLFIIQLERFPDEVVNSRWVDTMVMTNAYNGVIIPKKSIIYKTVVNAKKEEVQQAGVYIRIEGELYYKEVTVEGGAGDDVVVTGVDRGVEVLANPAKDLAKYQKKDKNEK